MTSIIIEKSKCCDTWYEIFYNFYQLFKINSSENMQIYLRSIDSWNIIRMRRDELKQADPEDPLAASWCLANS